jgi:hypothetical protein
MRSQKNSALAGSILQKGFLSPAAGKYKLERLSFQFVLLVYDDYVKNKLECLSWEY